MIRPSWLFLILISFMISSAIPAAITFSANPSANLAQTTNLPDGFVLADLATGLNFPTDLAIMPNGDILVTEKGTGEGEYGTSNVRLIKSGSLQAAPVLSLHTNVIDDSGLLSMVLDNNFADNNHFYLWYGPGQLAKQKGATNTFRLSRFTFDPERGTADPASEVVVHDLVPWTEWHNGGGIGFDAQGYLYIATGDMFDSNLSRDLTLRSGKLLRIRPTDSGSAIPSDNPYIGVRNIPSDLYAIGIRNPFRMTRRESDKKLFFADVGKWTWEEVNQVQSGADYGWYHREGLCPQGRRQPCTPASNNFTDPVFAYEHEGERGALTALAFYEGNSYPEGYRGNLFYVDGEYRYLATVDLESTDKTPERVASDVGFIVDMAYFNNNLYLLDIATGTVKVLYYSQDQAISPTLNVRASAQSGKAPFKIWVDARSSSSPRNLQLRYIWNWGDGSPVVTSDKGYRTYTYNQDGDYQVTLQAQDVLGATSDEMTIQFRVFSGELPKIVFASENRVNASHYAGGDAWTYEVDRASGAAGLAESPYSWNVFLNHNDHFHPIISGVKGASGRLEVDEFDHNDETNVWYRFELVMRTQYNQEIKVQKDLRPTFSHINLDSIPRPVGIIVNDVPLDTDYSLRRIRGMVQTVEAPRVIFHEGRVGRFAHWIVLRNGWPLTAASAPPISAASISGLEQNIETIAQAKLTIPTPSNNVTYLANYTMVGPIRKSYLPIISQ